MIELLLSATLVAAPAENYATVARVQDEQSIIMLQERQGICPAGWSMAVLAAKSATVFWLGCWQVRDGNVYLRWEDGDTGAGPIGDFEWRAGKRPVSL